MKMKQSDQQQEKFDIKKIKVGRTIEGTILEAITVMLLIGTWVIALAKHQFSGGMQNEWLQVAMIISIAAIALLVVAYFPRYMKNAHQLSNMRQVLISVRSLRVLAVEFALMILCNAIAGGTMLGQPFWTSIALAVIILTSLIFYLFIIRAKKNGE